jgi:hypothetical protein
MAKHTFRRKVAKPVAKASTSAVKWVGKGAKKSLRTGGKSISKAWKSLTK